MPVLTVVCVGVGDLKTADGALGFGPWHRQRVFCHLTEDYVGGRLRAWTVRRISWEGEWKQGRRVRKSFRGRSERKGRKHREETDNRGTRRRWKEVKTFSVAGFMKRYSSGEKTKKATKRVKTMCTLLFIHPHISLLVLWWVYVYICTVQTYIQYTNHIQTCSH